MAQAVFLDMSHDRGQASGSVVDADSRRYRPEMVEASDEVAAVSVRPEQNH